MEEVLYVRVTVPPSRSQFEEGTLLRGRFRILCGPRRGEERRFTGPVLQACKLLKKGIVAAVRGRTSEDGVFVLDGVEDLDLPDFRLEDFKAAPTAEVLEEVADATGVYLTVEEYAACHAALGSTGVQEVSAREDYERLAAAVGQELAERFARFCGWRRKWGADMLEGLFCTLGLDGMVDHVLLWQAARALRFRAARAGVSVADLVMRYPHILMQVWDDPALVYAVAEEIARASGKAEEELAAERAAAAAVERVKEAMEDGHCFDWKNRVSSRMFFRVGGDPQAVTAGWALVTSRSGRRLCGGLSTEKDGTRISLRRVARETLEYPRKSWDPDRDEVEPAVYAPGVYWSERSAAKFLARAALASAELRLAADDLAAEAARAARAEGRTLDAEQERFVREAASGKIVVLTGEAGTGKTQALKWLVDALRVVVPGFVPVVLAPTALAAYRAAEKTTGSGMTIHRYASILEEDADLFVEPAGDGREPLAPGLVLVDECSMLSPVVLQRLLRRLAPETRIVFSGDPAQLPPVGPAGVFHALIRLAEEKARGFSHVRLATNYRVGAGSEVYLAAREVRAGRPLPGGLSGVEVICVKSADAAVDACVSVAKEVTGGAWPGTPGEIFVLTPNRQLAAGAEKLNAALERAFAGGVSPGIPAVGTPVVCRRNDYADGGSTAPEEVRRLRHPDRKRDVYNGTPGVVAEVRRDGRTEVRVAYRAGSELFDAWYTLEEFSYWTEKAYALTVHKAQGGQAKNVVLVLWSGLKRRDLLYTAISRCLDDPPGTGRVVVITREEFLDAPYAEERPGLELTGGFLCGLYHRTAAELEAAPYAAPPLPPGGPKVWMPDADI